MTNQPQLLDRITELQQQGTAKPAQRPNLVPIGQGMASRQETCTTHGPFVSRRIMQRWTGCTECALQKQREEDESDKANQMATAIDRRIAQVVPERYRANTSDDFEVADSDPKKAESKGRALDAARRYVAGFEKHRDAGRCFVMSGPTGTGKTMLAYLILAGLIRRKHIVVAITSEDLATDLRAPYGKMLEKAAPQFQRLISAELLLIDDVGGDSSDPHERACVTSVINTRYADGRPTMLTTNLPFPTQGTAGHTLEAEIGPRAFDRISDNRGVFLRMDWPSYRRRR